jgi:N-acetylmuramoyl-L-alanine amidase
MANLIFYLLKVILCSGIFYVYYIAFLRNNRFHQYNRFYLLIAAILPWFIPLIRIDLDPRNFQEIPLPSLMQAMAGNHSEIETNLQGQEPVITWNNIVIFGFAVIGSSFLIRQIRSILAIKKLIRTHTQENLQGITLIKTYAEGTPFSYFRTIFWNNSIDLHSEVGRNMLQHELVHVQQRHSADKLFMELSMVISWCNPFSWLIKNELYLVHEFIADQQSIKDGDSAKLAEVLLTAAYPNQQYLFTNQYFFSPIKRRLFMLNKHNRVKYTYAKRIAALPIMALLTMLLAFRFNDRNSINIEPLNDKYTIIIDAGHGGSDAGTSINKLSEKDLALNITKAIKELNTDPSLEIILSRDQDIDLDISSRVNLTRENNADLFVSVHVNMVKDASRKGVELFIPNTTHQKYTESLGLANILNSKLESIMGGSMGIKTRNLNISVLNNALCPAALIECGNIANAENRQTLEHNSREIAGSILAGIKQYLLRKDQIIEELKKLPVNDTVPNKKKQVVISEIKIENRKTATVQTKDKKVVKDMIDKDSDVRTIVISEEKNGEKIYTIEKKGPTRPLPDNVQYYLNGKKITEKEMKAIDPDKIKSINVLKDESATKKYGEAAKEGVIEIETKEI